MEFVVLPDVPAGSGVLVSLPGWAGMRVIPHESGRPWIAGHWSDGDVLTVSAGGNRLVLFGPVLADAGELERRFGRVRSVADLDGLVLSLAGSFHVVASVGGVIRVQGSVSTARQVCYARSGGVTVAADQPRVLAELTGAAVDEELLALQLLAPYGPPWPLHNLCLWRGVESLRGDDYLLISPDGSARTVRWWRPPAPELGLKEGAAGVREALSAALRARAAGGRVLSADLSGGMDSTSLCYLAAHEGIPLITVHYEPIGPASDDGAWAAQCAATLGGGQHIILPHETAPQWYAALGGEAVVLEGPLPFDRSRPTLAHQLPMTAERGAAMHLQGINGDELFHPDAGFPYSFARRHPLRAVPRLRAVRARRGWSLGTTLRFVLGGASYPRWLSAVAGDLTRPWEWGEATRWEIRPMMPPWATPDRVESVRRLIRECAAGGPEPVSRHPVQHEMVRLTQMNGRIVRLAGQLSARSGMSVQAPFLDDRVLEAAMRVRLYDRMAGDSPKPVLGAAMRGIAPDEFIGRKTKGAATHEGYAAKRRHAELLELCEGSRLAEIGLIDARVLRASLTGNHDSGKPVMPPGPTYACELWLRSLKNEQQMAEVPIK